MKTSTIHCWFVALIALALMGCGDDDFTPPDDAPQVDASLPFDAGLPLVDAGSPETDAGSPDEDLGVPPEPDGGTEPPPPDFVANFPGAAMSLWPPYNIEKIERTEDNTLPVLGFDDMLIAMDHYVWDFWPLREPDGSIAVVDGRVVIMALTAPRMDNVPGERHGLATWRYFYSDGSGWVDGGLVFDDPIGERQWAGSAVYDPATGRVKLFYSALGELEPLPDGSDSPSGAADGWEDAKRTGPSLLRQQIAETSATLVSTPEGIFFERFSPHRIVLDADGEFYATAEQARDTGALYVFRDPWYFQDPATGEEYLLFSAASGFQPGPKNGVVGLAIWDEPTREWLQLAPILGAMETNSQLERPHIVMEDGRYHLFFSSHEFTFGGPHAGPEGLYGFYADHLRGHYLPMNDGALVLANPEEAPLQTYSWTVLPGGMVTSFVNYIELGMVTLEEIGDQSRDWQMMHFGGTPAEPFFIDIDGTSTALVPEDSVTLPSDVDALRRAF